MPGGTTLGMDGVRQNKRYYITEKTAKDQDIHSLPVPVGHQMANSIIALFKIPET